MRYFILAVVLVSACSSPSAEPLATVVTDDPVKVASSWLDAVDAVDLETLDLTVEPVGLVVLAGVENGLRSDEVVALLDAGFDDELAAGYWRSFRGDFEAIRGVSLGDLLVGSEDATSRQSGFTAVDVSGETGIGRIGLRRNDVGVWQVDMVATVGPALIGPLGAYLDSALVGDNAEAIIAAFRTGVLPGLEFAVALDPDNSDLVFETEYIRDLVGD